MAYGALASMALFAEHRAAGVDLYLNNKALVDVPNAPARRTVAAADVWDEIRLSLESAVRRGIRGTLAAGTSGNTAARLNALDCAGGCGSCGRRARGRRARFDRRQHEGHFRVEVRGGPPPAGSGKVWDGCLIVCGEGLPLELTQRRSRGGDGGTTDT